MKTLLKLVFVALLANAAWHLGSAYLSFYRFKDAVNEAVLFGATKPEAELRQRVLDLAQQFDLPITEDNFTVSRENHHTTVVGEYTQPVDLLPNYHVPWKFNWNVETADLSGLK